VVACPVDTCGILWGDLVSGKMISPNKTSDIHDVFLNPIAGYGGCVQACPYGVIKLAGWGKSIPAASVQ